jgi:hypothetical protein
MRKLGTVWRLLMTVMPSDRLGRARLAVIAAAVVIGAHGLVHLMGVALLWKLGQPGQLHYADAVPAPGSVAGYVVGGLWLIAAVLFVGAAVLLVAGRAAWGVTAVAAVAVSATVIGLAPGQAVAGLVIDGLVLVLVAGNWIHTRKATPLPASLRPLAAAQPVPVPSVRLPCAGRAQLRALGEPARLLVGSR